MRVANTIGMYSTTSEGEHADSTALTFLKLSMCRTPVAGLERQVRRCYAG